MPYKGMHDDDYLAKVFITAFEIDSLNISHIWPFPDNIVIKGKR